MGWTQLAAKFPLTHLSGTGREEGWEKTGVRNLMKQQENMEITSWSLSQTQHTFIGRNDIVYCQLSIQAIQFFNLISDSGTGKQNQEPFLLPPQVKFPLSSKTVNDVEGLQSGHRSFPLQLLSFLLCSLCVPPWAQHRFKSAKYIN